MKIVVIDFKKNRQVPKRLLEELKGQGCQICQNDRTLPSGRDVLILTDSQKTALAASRRGIACVGYEHPKENKPIGGVGLVVQDLDCLTWTLLERAYQRHHQIPWEIGRTPRLLIRESIPEDFDALYDICQAPGFCRHMPGMTGEREGEREYFQSYIRNRYPFYEYGFWTVLETESGRVVGRAGLEEREGQKGSILEVGYAIGAPWQNRGYATEAMGQVLRYAKDELEAEEVFAFIKPDNLASVKVAQKLGMVRIGEECWRCRLETLRSGD